MEMPSTKRSYIMSQVKTKNSKPEMSVRKLLWKNGYRYRLHDKRLPGTPDIVMRKHRVAIFVNGCFWHRHGCKYSTTPKKNRDFWISKFERNIERDRNNIAMLLELDWRVLVVWECSLKRDPSDLENEILEWLTCEKSYAEI